MSEQNVEELKEQDHSANETVSNGTLSQEASTTETVTRAELNEVLKELRGLQSKMDKDAHTAAKKIQSNLEERLSQLGVKLTPEQQMKNRLMELEELLASDGQGAAKPRPQTVKEPQTTPVDIVKIKEAFKEIDFNDPHVLAMVTQNLNNEEGLLTALGKVKVDGTAKPQATAASVTPPAGRVKASVSMEDLQAEYNRLLNDPVTFKKPENKQRRAEIIKLMEEKENA